MANNINIKRIERLREQVNNLKREADRAEGALQTILTRLRNEFNCNTIEEAEQLLEKLKKRLETAEENFESEIKKFEEKWHKTLR